MEVGEAVILALLGCGKMCVQVRSWMLTYQEGLLVRHSWIVAVREALQASPLPLFSLRWSVRWRRKHRSTTQTWLGVLALPGCLAAM